eukprot:TRINITY_DN8274_c0_g1_i3.p1 TRINITY_DN8274_c0_g1~~TRINITY_DN8274_c0_g1_i3.p1  ORF type:complete len:666 (+),score=63.68 TRINITY_DN8274_c0_g1_i3:46-2043(+)
MGNCRSKWDWMSHGNLRCDECSQIIEFSEEKGYANDCKGCHRELSKLYKLKEGQLSESPVALGKPETVPSLRQLEKIKDVVRGFKDLDHKVRFLYFTSGELYMSVPSALRVKNATGTPTIYLNILSEVTMALSKLPEDRIRYHLKDIIALNSWQNTPISIPFRMNRLSHGPQRHFRTSVTDSEMKSRFSKRDSYKFLTVRSDFDRLTKTTATDKLLISEFNAFDEITKNTVTLSPELYMWTSVLLTVLSPPKGITDFVIDDRLIALSFYFTVPMVDRTDTLNNSSCLRLKVQDPLPDYDPNFSKVEMSDLLNRRAREVLNRLKSDDRKICILWSGGIDSTAVTISFLKMVKEMETPCVLYVGITSVAVAEYPDFYSQHLQKYAADGIVTFLQIDEEVPLSTQLDLERFIYVTGECGDQLFGSDIMANAFSEEELARQFSFSAPPNPSPRFEYNIAYRHKEGLDAPWEETFLESLVASGLEKDREGWKKWIAPHLEKCPIKVKTTFDLLWWLNITLKWQHVVLRIFNFRKVLSQRDLDSVVHFFNTDYFQQWSFANHDKKLPDKKKWSTYKHPLKKYIFDYTKDEDYYKNKLKCGSLGCVMPPTSGQNDVLAIDSNLNLISHGVSSILASGFEKKYGTTIQDKFLRPLPQRVGSPRSAGTKALPEA